MTLAGQVGVVTKNPGWYGRLVQFFTGSPAFHCVTAISETECVSAETPIVLIRPISDFDGIQWTNVPFTSLEREATVRYVKDQVGKPYAYWDIFFLLIAMITRTHTPKWITTRLMDQRHWFCSELCDAGLIEGGQNLFGALPMCAVTPADFLKAQEQEMAVTA